jgi:hypothetical protein
MAWRARADFEVSDVTCLAFPYDVHGRGVRVWFGRPKLVREAKVG